MHEVNTSACSSSTMWIELLAHHTRYYYLAINCWSLEVPTSFILAHWCPFFNKVPIQYYLGVYYFRASFFLK